jgi:hypothetical protein
MSFETILHNIDQKKTAFLVGNGINLYRNYLESALDCCPQRTPCNKKRSSKKTMSWSDFLQKYTNQKEIGIDIASVNDLSFPEIVCLIDLHQSKNASGKKGTGDKMDIDSKVRKRLSVDLINIKKQDPVHRQFLDYATTRDIPVLTTNMDRLLSLDLPERKLAMTGAPYFKASKGYKWNYCYTERSLPSDNHSKLEFAQHFAVWHIHGLCDYPDDIKIGLDDYINCTSQAKKLLSSYGRNRRSLFDAKTDDWVGSNTWLDLFFRRELIIFGLSLDSQEVFLRWLLIQRARYLKMRFPDPTVRPGAWFVHVDANMHDKTPKGIFFKACGIGLIREKRYCGIYRAFSD